MTELDLSRLTDEERELREKAILETDPHAPPRWFIRDFTNALIAARAEIAAFREAARHSAKRHAELDGISDELILCRADLNAARAENKRLLQDLLDTRELAKIFLAENKRLRKGLGEFADYMDTADNLSDEGREDEAIEVRERVRHGMRALLQSEKGGE